LAESLSLLWSWHPDFSANLFSCDFGWGIFLMLGFEIWRRLALIGIGVSGLLWIAEFYFF
tara:strand:- start:1588 stop:1767 length:180 start_codon:yes stop_codon:yes gene_type:complete